MVFFNKLFLVLFILSQNINLVFGLQDTPTTPKNLTHTQTYTNPDFRDEEPSVRIKDITTMQGVRDNFLVGRGLVVGLNGTGDSLGSSPQTKESLVSMLERLGVNVRDGNINGKNVAMVMVTAVLPAFARSGSKIDVSVSAIGDAKSLSGGTLVVTALKGADDQVYAVAQGNISVSGISAQGINAQQAKGVPTAGKIANGALIEKEIAYEFSEIKQHKLLLSSPDTTTVKRIAEAINAYGKSKQWGDKVANAQDMGAIELTLPHTVKPLDALHELSHLEIKPDNKARIVIDENNGVIAMSSKTRISPVALTHGSITIKVVETPQVYMPNTPFGVLGGGFSSNMAGNKGMMMLDQIAKVKESQQKQLDLLKQQQKSDLEAITDSDLKDAKQKEQQQEILKKNLEFEKVITELEQKASAQSAAAAAGNSALLGAQALAAGGAFGALNGNLPNVNGAAAGVAGAGGGFPQPVVTTQTDLNVKEEKGKFSLLSSGVSIDKFVNALNQLGVTVKDMGSILMAIKNAGALHAEIKIG